MKIISHIRKFKQFPYNEPNNTVHALHMYNYMYFFSVALKISPIFINKISFQ